MPIMGMVTLQAYRLENTDANHFKQYTVLADSNHVLFFNSRIGNNWVNQSPKSLPPDPVGKARSQIKAKESGGYDLVWHGDVTVPEQWANDPKLFTRQLQDFVEGLYREGAQIGVAHGAPGTDVAGETRSILRPVLDECSNLVSKMAVDPDTAMTEYAALVGRYESVKNEMEVVEGYMDTLRLMLAGQEART